jgi:hypothetical protein
MIGRASLAIYISQKVLSLCLLPEEIAWSSDAWHVETEAIRRRKQSK